MYEQTVFYGSPGTGKSNLIDKKLKKVSNCHIIRVTIHPEYSYTDFVGQLLPTLNSSTGTYEFKFSKGPLTQALIEAFSDSNKNVYLVLEELSRGNTAAIFGDLFQLLDRDDFGCSTYPIYNEEIASHLTSLVGNNIYFPTNLNILASVNLNDQNVFPMDTAFKRRFDWEYIPTKPVVDEHGTRVKELNNPKITILSDKGNIITNWQSFYSSLNSYITDRFNGLNQNEDRQIGQFFIKFSQTQVKSSHNNVPDAISEVNNLLKNKLLMYLWQDVEIQSIQSDKKIFSSNINSFEDLHSKFDSQQVFSDQFLEAFLRPNQNAYTF